MTTQEMNTTDALRAILDNLEMEQSMRNKNETISYVNQPEKIAISSNSGEQAQVTYNGQFQNAFYNFTVNLPRPALGVKSIELLSANIPQCQVNIPDESLIFFYYRLQSALNNAGNQTVYIETPSVNNMHYVRLLPSYYKQELVQEYPSLGFNKTFANYTELEAELVKACADDLIYIKYNDTFGNQFIPDDISITYNQDINKFQFIGNNTTEAWVPTTWTAGTYQKNAIVRYLAVNYISLVNNNTSTPSSAPVITAWVTSPQVYLPLNKVSYLGVNYTCIYENNGIEPIGNVNSATYWIPLTWSAAYNYAGIRAAPYNLGWPVFYNGLYYTNLDPVSNINQQPDISPAYWVLTTLWIVYTGTTGYTYLSAGYEDPNVFEFAQSVQELSLVADFDFNNLDGVNGLTLYSIPPQPIAQYQTLNLRLGFTWNGIYSWTSDTIFPGILKDVYRNGSIPAMLFNRLRPVPYYQLILPASGLVGDPIINGNPYTSTTYTADAFANLVYSSIINIYTNIIGPSTTDTEQNINLLDTVPLNCANLGITFYNPVISNKLTKIPPDIYTIYFEFRREDGSEYYFSNNAIITLTLGLTYK